jgi:2-oxoglutarate ferredoxin oxidoreductase subunit alpha
MKNNSRQVFTVAIGGAAGDGAKEATINFGRLVARHGFEFYLSVDYPSLIKGGHNFARVSFCAQKLYSDFTSLDALIALNAETVAKHKKEMKKNAVVFLDAVEAPPGVIAVPASVWAKEAKAPPIMRASALLGAMAYYFNLDIDKLNAVFVEIFGSKAQPNILLAAKGYEFMVKNKAVKQSLPKYAAKGKKYYDGNEAFAEGLVAAGLKNYFAYPMTPSSSILHYLAKKARDYKLKVIQPENEIAVINMALGSAYAGVRTAVASSCGGFALMLEAMAMAGMEEIPIVAADSARASSSTGVPTRTGQGDLDFVRHMPGEFPRLVMAPGDVEESFLLGAEAMNLAWQYQIPAVVLLDKQISESVSTAELPADKIKIMPAKPARNGKYYQRYAFTAGGVSPLAYPGDKDTVVKVASYEHDENGYITDDPETVKRMYEKRFAKMAGLIREMKKRQSIKIWGDKTAKNVIVFFGSTKGAALEAIKLIKKPIRAVQALWLEPFDDIAFLKAVKGAKKIVCVENDFTGQFQKLIRQKTGLEIKRHIRRYDSLPFDPEELAKQLNKIF